MTNLGTPAQRHLPPGASLQDGKYRIVSVLGQGGFGITYLAQHKNFGEVALKELFLSSGTAQCSRENTTQRHVVAHFDKEQFEDFKNRFLEEARTLYKLRDVKGVVKVLDIFEENSTVYFSMEYLQGDKLEDYVKKRNKLPEYEGVKIISSIGKTLSGIHKRNVLHRDIKPANIIVGPTGDTYLIDFGIARSYADDMSETHTTFHSPRYSPPEQKIAKSRMGTFSDVYSLGATAYFILTGEVPQSLEERITEDYVSPQSLVPGLSDSVNAAINHSLTIREKERIQNVDDFLLALGKPSAPREVKRDFTPPPQYTPSSDEVTKIFHHKKPPPQIEKADDATQIEPPKAQAPPKNIVQDDKTMLLEPTPSPTTTKKTIVEDDKTMLIPQEMEHEPVVDEEKTLIIGQDIGVKEPKKPKLPFNFKEWIKTREGRIIGTSVVLSVLCIIAVLLSPIIFKPKPKVFYVAPPRDTTTVQAAPVPTTDTALQAVVPVVEPVAPELPAKDAKSNSPAKSTKPPIKKDIPKSVPYKPSSSTSPINEVPTAQAPARIESVTPNNSQVVLEGNGIILNRDMSCVIKGESGTYRKNRQTNEWTEFVCITSHNEYSVFYYKSTKILKIESKN